MAESLTLTSPTVINKQITGYRISKIELDWDAERILIRFTAHEDPNDTRQLLIEGSEALTMMRALNTADLRTNSLQRRIFNQAIIRGVFAGAITGTPDA